jgi:lipid-binding SYLF domain-containing protein
MADMGRLANGELVLEQPDNTWSKAANVVYMSGRHRMAHDNTSMIIVMASILVGDV